MSEQKHPDAPWRNFYGRRHGKALRSAQEDALETLMPQMHLPGIGWEENPDRAPVDLGARFGKRPVWLEIGFGSGEHLFHLQSTEPDPAIIGCEPFVNGVATLASKFRENVPDNVAIHPGDARDLLDVLPAASLSRVYLLYPDPWPKKRHHRRRFVNTEFLEPLATAMALGAELRIATDIPDYVRQALEVILPMPQFTWLATSANDWRKPWDNWYSTRYEQKALREGRTPHYLRFARNEA